MHGKGRVFYTSLGHREDVWTNPTCQKVVLGGFAWALGNVEADVSPNIEKVTPGAWQLKCQAARRRRRSPGRGGETGRR